MKDLSIIETAFNKSTNSEELINNIYLGEVIKLYNNKANNLEQLYIINNKNKLTVADIYEIITSKYPEYISQLIIENKANNKLKNEEIFNKIITIINNCKEEYQAFGIVFFITQTENIDTNYLIKISEILSTTNTIPKMYYTLKIAIISSRFINNKKTTELTKIISNSLTDNHAKYAYDISRKNLNELKNPIKPAYKASKIKKLKLNNNPNICLTN